MAMNAGEFTSGILLLKVGRIYRIKTAEEELTRHGQLIRLGPWWSRW